jgi:hypothetical protein
MTSVQTNAAEGSKPSSSALDSQSIARENLQTQQTEPAQASATLPHVDNATTPSQNADISPKSNLWLEARDVVLQSKDASNWKKFQNELKISDAFSIDLVLASLQEKKTIIEDDQWGYVMENGRNIVFRDVIDKIIGWAGAFKDIGSSIASFDLTNHAGLAWGSVQVLVTVSLIRFTFKPSTSLLTCVRLR